MTNEQRTEDEKLEKRNTDFFCENYLDKISANYKVTYDKNKQVLGNDLELYGRALSAVVDIKAKTYMYDKLEDIYDNGIGMELSRLCRDNVRREGWFIDDRNITDMYVFLLPKEKNFNVQEQTAIFVSKNAVINEVLKELTWNQVCELSSFVPPYGRKGQTISEHFYFTKSFQYTDKNGKEKMVEEPVNLCMKIGHLCKIAKKVVHITPNGFYI